MNQAQIKLVQDSFDKVIPIADTAADLFYADLFDTAPEVKPLFESADMKAQGKMLMTTLGVVVRGLGNFDMVLPAARDLAERHVRYGVEAQHYAKVGGSLIRTLEQGLGAAFTPATRDGWIAAYAALSNFMIEAAYGSQEAAQ